MKSIEINKMTNKELEKQLNMSYEEQLTYLKEKYGPAKENYFLTVNCDRKSTKIGRGNEGLFCHHDYEYDPQNPLTSDLSKPEIAKQFTYKYQEAENLTYCNYLEHLLLHCKINLLRGKQLGHYIQDSVVNHFIPILNDLYRYRIKDMKEWQKIAFSLIKYDYDSYVEIIRWWIASLGTSEERRFPDWKKWSKIE